MVQNLKLVFTLLIITFLGSSFTTSSLNTELAPNTASVSPIIVSNNAYANAPSDFLRINFSTIEDEIIMFNVNYYGGCGSAAFNLIADSKIDNSGTIPVVNARISFADNDKCNQVVNKTLKYDLSPLKMSKCNQIQINIQNFGSVIYSY